MSEKTKAYLGLGLGGLVLIGVIFYILGGIRLEFWNLVMVIIPIILAIGAFVIMWDRLKSVKSGLPVEDERVKKLHWKAGAYAYYVTIWLAVGIIWYNIFTEELGFPAITSNYIAVAILLPSAMFYFIFQFYFRRKGDV